MPPLARRGLDFRVFNWLEVPFMEQKEDQDLYSSSSDEDFGDLEDNLPLFTGQHKSNLKGEIKAALISLSGTPTKTRSKVNDGASTSRAGITIQTRILRPKRNAASTARNLHLALLNASDNHESDFEAEKSSDEASLTSDDESQKEPKNKHSVRKTSNRGQDPASLQSVLPATHRKQKYTWSTPSSYSIMPFHECIQQPPSSDQYASYLPSQFFNELCTDEFLKSISLATEVNFRSNHKQDHPIPGERLRKLNLNENPEIMRKFIGILIWTSADPKIRIKDYWNVEKGNQYVQKAMSRHLFLDIMYNLKFTVQHVPQRGEDGYHPLGKILPVLKHCKEKFLQIPIYDTKFAIDEQMIASKHHHSSIVYVKNKPKKWGFKNFALCGSQSGIMRDFNIYSGATKMPEETAELGATYHVVSNLAASIPEGKNFQLTMDNYFTGIPLFVALGKKQIWCTGTVRENRLGKAPLPKNAQLKDTERGTSFEVRTKVDGIELAATKLKDTKIVVFLSSVTGIGPRPLQGSRRYQRKKGQQGEYMFYGAPEVTKVYNRSMGGVDLMDQELAHARIWAKTNKYTVRIFLHFLNCMVVNAWNWYNCVQKQLGKPTMQQLDFRTYIAKVMMGTHTFLAPRRGRPVSTPSLRRSPSTSISPSLLLVPVDQNPRKRYRVADPPDESRFDNLGHLVYYKPKKQFCKFPGCKSSIRTFCIKCQVALCVTHKQCFVRYHDNCQSYEQLL